MFFHINNFFLLFLNIFSFSILFVVKIQLQDSKKTIKAQIIILDMTILRFTKKIYQIKIYNQGYQLAISTSY